MPTTPFILLNAAVHVTVNKTTFVSNSHGQVLFLLHSLRITHKEVHGDFSWGALFPAQCLGKTCSEGCCPPWPVAKNVYYFNFSAWASPHFTAFSGWMSCCWGKRECGFKIFLALFLRSFNEFSSRYEDKWTCETKECVTKVSSW
jgi:hypothetical protein